MIARVQQVGVCRPAHGEVHALQCGLLDLLDEQVPLVFRSLAVMRSDDARRAVKVQHVDQLLFLVLQLLNLCFQLSV